MNTLLIPSKIFFGDNFFPPIIWLMVGRTNFFVKDDLPTDCCDVWSDVGVDMLFGISFSENATLFFVEASTDDVVDNRARFLSAFHRRNPGATSRLFEVSRTSLSSLDVDEESLLELSRPRFMLMLELSELVMASLMVLCFLELADCCCDSCWSCCCCCCCWCWCNWELKNKLERWS